MAASLAQSGARRRSLQAPAHIARSGHQLAHRRADIRAPGAPIRRRSCVRSVLWNLSADRPFRRGAALDRFSADRCETSIPSLLGGVVMPNGPLLRTEPLPGFWARSGLVAPEGA